MAVRIARARQDRTGLSHDSTGQIRAEQAKAHQGRAGQSNPKQTRVEQSKKSSTGPI